MAVGPEDAPRTYWAGAHDNEDLYFGVALPVDGPVGRVVTDDAPSQPLRWSGNHYVHSHQDGTSTLSWRVRLIDYDMYTGEVIQGLGEMQFRIER